MANAYRQGNRIERLETTSTNNDNHAADPASTLQFTSAKHLGANELEEFRHRHAVLELEAIHGHDAAPKYERWLQMTPLQAHQVSLAEDRRLSQNDLQQYWADKNFKETTNYLP